MKPVGVSQRLKLPVHPPFSYSINTNTIGSDSADIENQATRCVGTMGRLDPAGG